MPRPKVAGDMFGDLLGTQGFDFSSTKKDSGPKTINAMRKEELAKDIDPDKMKVSFVIGQLTNMVSKPALSFVDLNRFPF